MLTTLAKDNIDEALMMEFYTNTYDTEGTYPTKVKVWDKTVKFDVLNNFLKTPMNL